MSSSQTGEGDVVLDLSAARPAVGRPHRPDRGAGRGTPWPRRRPHRDHGVGSAGDGADRRRAHPQAVDLARDRDPRALRPRRVPRRRAGGGRRCAPWASRSSSSAALLLVIRRLAGNWIVDTLASGESVRDCGVERVVHRHRPAGRHRLDRDRLRRDPHRRGCGLAGHRARGFGCVSGSRRASATIPGSSTRSWA